MLALEDTYLCGMITPLVTPFRRGAVDYDAYGDLVEFQISNGAHGLLLNGPMSEASSLTLEERNRLVEVAIEVANGRTMLVVSTGAASLAETRELTRFAAADSDVDAVLVPVPSSPRPPQRGLLSYFRALNKLHDKPWLIGHAPGAERPDVTLETAIAIDKMCPSFVGMSHASLDLGYVSALLYEISEDLRIFCGLDAMSYPMMAVGACGTMGGVGNIIPRAVVDMCEAVWDGDLNKARDLNHSLYELNRAVTFDVNPIPLKYMMKRMGIMPGNDHRLPLTPAQPELEKQLDYVLRRTGMIRGGHA